MGYITDVHQSNGLYGAKVFQLGGLEVWYGYGYESPQEAVCEAESVALYKAARDIATAVLEATKGRRLVTPLNYLMWAVQDDNVTDGQLESMKLIAALDYPRWRHEILAIYRLLTLRKEYE